MDRNTIAVTERTAAASISGELKFPQVVAMLAAAGVERYHTDYTRREKTFYWSDGDFHDVPLDHPARPIAAAFDAAPVRSAIRASQHGEISYPQFIDRTTAAGCVGYFVQIAGRRAIYLGRNGESHMELFPTSAPPAPGTA